MNSAIPDLRKKLKTKLNPSRYEHSLSVSFTCMSLAMRYGYDLDKAELAGLLHDCAKQYHDSELITKCQNQQLPLSEDERKAPMVIHAKYGAWMTEFKYHITEKDILTAIQYHTTGNANMGLLDKILFVADYIEPRRYKASDLEEIRKIAFIDLDECVYRILQGTLDYLNHKGMYIDTTSLLAYDYYKNQRSNGKGSGK